jgi:RNA-directed DNA polymerase
MAEEAARGEMIIVRYADDGVLGFERREDAERFLEQLRERLRKFGLELHPEKTRLIEFGRYAAERREKREEAKPKPSTFWVSLTSVGPTIRRVNSPCIGRRSAGAWQLGSKNCGPN